MFAPNFTYPDVDKTCDWIIMQYTGLKDRDNNEIYEGDFIETFSTNGRYGEEQKLIPAYKGEIIWNEYSCAFVCRYKQQLNPWTGYIKKIMGNTFENPELIK
jgi:uncharacterized phage protein (TIGR01671 family)